MTNLNHSSSDDRDATLPKSHSDDGASSVSVDAPMQPFGEDHGTPGDQKRPLTDDEKLDKSLEDTFPTSDPVTPSRIDGPNN